MRNAYIILVGQKTELTASLGVNVLKLSGNTDIIFKGTESQSIN